jgi:DNA-binding protein H-NS
MATLESIKTKIKRLQEQAEAIRVKQATATLDRIAELMRKSGLTVADIETHFGGKKHRGRPAKKSAVGLASPIAKYQDPKTGATWSGRGRAPAWIAQAKNRNRFLVDGNASAASAASAVGTEAKRQGDYVRGPQPAKYRDPKSGATWSGRGRAPAWMANAKDRTKFLIEAEA